MKEWLNNLFASIKNKNKEIKEVEGKNNMEEMNLNKKYIYLAFNENYNVILNEKGEPLISNITDENANINWPENINKYTKKVFSDPLYSVEIPEAKSVGKERKEEKRKNRQKAIEELLRLSADKIAEAKKISEINISKDKEVEECKKEQAEFSNQIQNVQNTENIKSKECINNDEIFKSINSFKEDINFSVNDICETIEKSKNEINASVDDICETIEKGRDKIIAQEQTKNIVNENKKNIDKIFSKINEFSKNLINSQNEISSKVNSTSKKIEKMEDVKESVECIEGKLNKMSELLENKGLNISMEIPPVNFEEEDIINLVHYSQKITEQLGYAARDFIRKQEVFKSQDKNNENEQKMMQQKIQDTYREGIQEGKKQFIKQLLSKYQTIDDIKDSSESRVHVIWTMLTELGVVIDGEGEYEKGKEIEFSDEDIEKMMSIYSKFDGAGKYKVVKTGLSYKGEIISEAEFEKIN